MQTSELRELTLDEMRVRLAETRREWFNLRQQWYAGSLEDFNRMRAVRREIARMLTVLRERELAQESEEGGGMKERRKQLVGIVTSDKMEKTVVVRVERRYRHPLYQKVVTSAKKYMAHDEGNACRVGDKVRIVESRPLSRHKRWTVETILERAA